MDAQTFDDVFDALADTPAEAANLKAGADPVRPHISSTSDQKPLSYTPQNSVYPAGWTPDSPAAPRRPRRMPRVPPFYPVPTRTRSDGWTVQRQADFLGMLAETGSVMGACEAVGMSRKSAYALRARPGAESFAAAWDAALGAPVRKVTPPELNFLAGEGLVRVMMFRGRYRGSWARPDKSALLRLVRRLDRTAGGVTQ